MMVRAHLILAGAVLLRMADPTGAEPYPVSFHSSQSISQSVDWQRGDSTTDDRPRVDQLLADADLHLGIPWCDGISVEQYTPSPSIHKVAWVRGRGASLGVAEMPPLPGSAELFLSAIMGMGAWHLARQSRDLRPGAWPIWYQTSEPIQVRHIFALDVRFEALARPTVQSSPRLKQQWYVRTRSDRPRLSSEWAGSFVGPRAPPSWSKRHD